MRRNYLIDFYRAILTLFVLLYHLGLCKAGFLAVCGFFVISGYLLACTINDFDFDLKKYYLKRLKSLYIPLIIVVFITVFVFRYVINIPWVSIKQETLSVLFSYNNLFQIKADSNYFIRSDASPFTHMWYISILMQIELVFPFVVYILKKYRIELNKKVLLIISVLSIVCFVLIDNKYGMAHSYYNTFSRLFSFLIGYSVYYYDYFSLDNKPIIVALLLTITIFLVGDLSQKYYVLLMICMSAVAGGFILLSKDIDFKEYKLIKFICKISYFVYLVQYPIIYIIDASLDCAKAIKVLIEIVLIIVLSIVFTYGLSNSTNKLKKIVLVTISLLTFIGGISYITCPDYYKQMEELKIQLEQNQNILAQKQAEYLQKMKDRQDEVLQNVGQIDEAIENLDETVANADVLLIGDSIMLGGSFHLDEYFNNYYCDAKGSRNGYLAYETLSELLEMGVVKDYIVIHLGTNSGLELEEVESIASLLDKQKVLWLTVTNGWRTSQNPMLEEYCNTHENNYLADWYEYSLGHSEYFIEDGLHLSDEGRHIYDQFIFDSLKQIIKDDLLEKKQAMIDDYNDKNNDAISFYGNDILINLYEDLSDDYLCYVINDYDSLYEKLKENKDNLCLSKTVFILLDKNMQLTEKQIDEINELLNDNNVYIYAYQKDVNDLSVVLGDDCLLQDGIHLNEKGNELLLDQITKKIH